MARISYFSVISPLVLGDDHSLVFPRSESEAAEAEKVLKVCLGPNACLIFSPITSPQTNRPARQRRRTNVSPDKSAYGKQRLFSRTAATPALKQLGCR
jgi:hypothetical protein